MRKRLVRARERLRLAKRNIVAALHQFRQSEIEDLHPAVAGEENIRRLQIAVDDSLLVRRGHSARHLRRDLERFAHRNRALLHALAQRLAFEQLHHQERAAVVRADVVNRQNVRVIERADRARFLLESPQMVGVGRKRRRQNFYGHVALQARVARAIHFAHPARANRRNDLVRPQFCSRRKRHNWPGLYIRLR